MTKQYGNNGNRWIYAPEHEILKILKAELNRINSVNVKDYAKYRDREKSPSINVIYNRFKNWPNAVKLSGLDIKSNPHIAWSNVDDGEILNIIHAELVRIGSTSIQDYTKYRNRTNTPSSTTVLDRFDNWITVLNKIGLKSHRQPRQTGVGFLKQIKSSKIKNLTGTIFGRLTVLNYSGHSDKYGRAVWHCQCSCGTLINVDSKSLLSGNTTSCGCKNLEHKQRIDQLKETHRVNGVLVPTLKSKLRVDSKTGVKGVYFNKHQEQYVAQIQVGHKHIYLGAFAKLQDAAEARREAEDKYFKPILDKEKKNK